MSADRTPAPVAVPEGGWREGDAVMTDDLSRDALARLLWRERHVEWARGGCDLWDTVPDYEKTDVYRMADAVLAAGYRLVPEDDEDTVRVPPTDIADAIVEGCTHGADHPEVDAFAPCGRCLAAALIARDYR